jgi:hypothetical protein
MEIARLGPHRSVGVALSRSSVCHAACALRLKLIDLCVGVKSNGGTRSLYRSRHELVLYSAAAAVK